MADHPIMHTMFESLMILIFEMFGTGMLTMLFISTSGGLGFGIGFFVLLIFSARISGSHYNPVVTLAYMLRKDAGQFNKWLGILYMLAQLGGALLGALFVFYCFDCKESYITLYPNTKGNYPWIQCAISETLGAFILVLAYLTQTEENYKLSSDAAITLLLISMSYVVGIALSDPVGMWTQSPLNPAVALSIMTFATFDGNMDLMHFSWIFLTFAWGGSCLAVLCFELVFKKAANAVEHKEEMDEENKEIEAVAEISQPLAE